MTLTLRIRNVDRLDNGMPVEFALHRRGAIIGRSPTCDWSLPDTRNYISSRHCEIAYLDGHYHLSDISTNGTFLNGGAERMTGPRKVEPGDLFTIGQYEVVAELTGDAVVAIERDQERAQQSQSSGWTGWDSHAGGGETPAGDSPANTSGWDAPSGRGGSGWGAPPPPQSASDGWGNPPPPTGQGSNASWAPSGGPGLARPEAHRAHAVGATPAQPASFGGGWAPSHRAPDIAVKSAWEAQIAAPDPASAWSSAAPDRPPPPSTDDIWGKIADGNVVDWARGGFGQPVEENRDPLGLNKPDAAAALPAARPQVASAANSWGPSPQAGSTAHSDWGSDRPPPTPPQDRGSTPSTKATAPPAPPHDHRLRPSAPPEPTVPPPTAGSSAGLSDFLAAAGLSTDQLQETSPETLRRAGGIFRKLIAGLVVMVEARARAKSQMGAETTSLEFDGNNPIKFARTPEQAITQLLNPPQRGFMEADRAVEDAFYDLQSHQMATLKAMQGALKATLDRFSPHAIKSRAEHKGVLTKIMPGARDAALWAAYEREFSGVAQGSDEAFMDVFAKEFRRAYEEQSRKRR